jgi:formylglycine-generating enzyme required for sulfatase activity
MKRILSLLCVAGISAALFIVSLHLLSGSSAGNTGYVDCATSTVPTGMKCIPGGPFIRGSNRTTVDEDSWRKVRDEAPEMTVSVSTFFMDTNEVTFSEYQKCVQAKGCRPARPNYRGYSRPNQPMLGVNWHHAHEYCRWIGKRLPTEAEWEKAARGADGELYPWGNANADCTRAIIQEKGKKGCGKGTTWDVGSRPPNRYGLYDMAGNSWEWVHDWYSADYAKCGAHCAGIDPKGPCEGKLQCPGHTKKVVRGGSWWWNASYTLGSNRRPHYASNRPYHHFGFRCAKSAEKSEN